MKFCKDCKHCVLDNKYKMCKKGEIVADLVDGCITYINLCKRMRKTDCGEDAKLFEPTLWYKVQTFFRKD